MTWAAFRKILEAINAVCGIIPPLVWALALAASGVAYWWVDGELALSQKATKTAQAEAKTWKDAHEKLTGDVEHQKAQAKAEYDELKRDRDEKQARLNEAQRAQEKIDANHQAALNRAARAVDDATAATGGRLRDPWAQTGGCGQGGRGADGGPGTGSAAGGGDAPQAGGLLSAELSERLKRREAEADAINVAYAACRADVYRVRHLPVPPDNDPAPLTAASP